jgi:ergothioneine biosynthesis protein EgtB
MPDTRLAAPPGPEDGGDGHAPADVGRRRLAERFQRTRARTAALASRLSPEDQMVCSHDDAAPAKWHLAHSTWVFEALVCGRFLPAYRPFDPLSGLLFAGGMLASGPCVGSDRRPVLSRPSAEEVRHYREHVNAAVLRALDQAGDGALAELAPLLAFAVDHEQRHQERLLTDVKHAFWCSPLLPAYQDGAAPPAAGAGRPAPLGWTDVPDGPADIGRSDAGVGRDDEAPRHRVLLEACRIAGRPVSCAEFLEFVEDGGYRDPGPWTADGWEACRAGGWRAPLYWLERGGGWHVFTLGGLRPLDPAEPVCHVSWYEADAFARWAGARLPDEAEWEAVAARRQPTGNLLESDLLHPRPSGAGGADPAALYGDVWEWTRSPYLPYPGHRPPAGPAGAPRSRFMANRMVLRGGSCLTPPEAIRATGRHGLRPEVRWRMTGVRLAADAR